MRDDLPTFDGVGAPLVLQAPIGSAGTAALVAAVGEAGGMGCLSFRSPAVMASEIRAVRRQTGAPLAVNLIGDADLRGHVDVVVESGVEAAWFSWGSPAGAVSRLRAAGCLVLAQVGSGDQARRAVDAGVDVLVVQGSEAGGRLQGATPLAVLLDEVCGLSGVPVVAAGGIADVAQARRVLDRGAAAIAMGTRFVATGEGRADSIWQRGLIDAPTGSTVVTNLFERLGSASVERLLPSRVLAEWLAVGSPTVGNRPGEDDVVAWFNGEPICRYDGVPPIRGMNGRLDLLPLPAGSGVGAIDAVEPAAQIVQRFTVALRTARLSRLPDERLAGLVLRDATSEDEPFCTALRREWARPYIDSLWGWDEADQVERAADNFRTGKTRILVDQDGAAIGYLRTDETPDHVFLEQVALLPECRRHGIGAALVDLVAREAAPRPTRLTVLAGNPAIRLYERLGFHITAADSERRSMEKPGRPAAPNGS